MSRNGDGEHGRRRGAASGATSHDRSGANDNPQEAAVTAQGKSDRTAWKKMGTWVQYVNQLARRNAKINGLVQRTGIEVVLFVCTILLLCVAFALTGLWFVLWFFVCNIYIGVYFPCWACYKELTHPELYVPSLGF